MLDQKSRFLLIILQKYSIQILFLRSRKWQKSYIVPYNVVKYQMSFQYHCNGRLLGWDQFWWALLCWTTPCCLHLQQSKEYLCLKQRCWHSFWIYSCWNSDFLFLQWCTQWLCSWSENEGICIMYIECEILERNQLNKYLQEICFLITSFFKSFISPIWSNTTTYNW